MIPPDMQKLFHIAQWTMDNKRTYVKNVRELAGTEEDYAIIIREIDRVEAQLRRARALRAEATLTLVDWLTTLEYFHWQCAYCGVQPFQVMSHYLQLPEGGTTPDNCVPSCYRCRSARKIEHPSVQAYLMYLKGKSGQVTPACPSSPRVSEESRLILIADDHWVNSFVLDQVILQRTRHRAVHAVDGVSVLKFLKHMKPDLLVLEYHLPGMNGIELYDRLRAEPDYRTLPVLMIGTALPAEPIGDRQITSLPKPLNLDAFLLCLERLLDK
jgi:CheY-like chemotaxis protein